MSVTRMTWDCTTLEEDDLGLPEANFLQYSYKFLNIQRSYFPALLVFVHGEIQWYGVSACSTSTVFSRSNFWEKGRTEEKRTEGFFAGNSSSREGISS